MNDELKSTVDAATFNKTVREQIKDVEETVYTSSPTLVINYPNMLDVKGDLYCNNVLIPKEKRAFDEPDIFKDFFLAYRTSISPRIYQRWALLSALGAAVGRNMYMEEEGKRTYPNMYVSLVGESGSGKSTAIDMIKPVMKRAGYTAIAEAATTKDKFLLDMNSSFSYAEEKTKSLSDQLDEEIFKSASSDKVSEGWICCHEWNEYFRTQGNQGNFDFIHTLLAMYDNPDTMATRSKVGGSVHIVAPTLSIIGGSTINNLLQFAPILSAEPFYSRTVLVYSQPTNQVYKPTDANRVLIDRVVSKITAIRDMRGKITFAQDGARDLFDSIIETSGDYRVPDSRLSPYYSRRNLHLRKVCMLLAIASGKQTISVYNVMHANSILTFNESFMQRALGEYGGLRQGAAETVVMQELNSSPVPLSATALIQRTHHVVDGVTKLGEICAKLYAMGRIRLNDQNNWVSAQREFRIDSIFARIHELYEYH